MPKKTTAIIVVLFCSISLCAQQPAIPNDANHVVAVYGDSELTLGQIEFIRPGADYDMIKKVAEYWLNVQILSEAAEEAGLDKSDKVNFLTQLSRRKLMGDEFIQNLIATIEITDEQIKSYYDENLNTDSRLMNPAYLSFSHITVSDANKAETILKKVNDGGDINALAKEFSEAPDAAHSGRIIKYKARMVISRFGKQVHDALVEAEEGQIIGPVKNAKGQYEIIRHEGKIAAKAKEIDEAKDYIKSTLERKTKKELVDGTIAKLKAKAEDKYQKKGILAEKDEEVSEKKDSQNDD